MVDELVVVHFLDELLQVEVVFVNTLKDFEEANYHFLIRFLEILIKFDQLDIILDSVVQLISLFEVREVE